MKKLIALMLVLVMAVSFAACSQPAAEEPAAPKPLLQPRAPLKKLPPLASSSGMQLMYRRP